MQPELFTIGHSTHSLDQFLGLLAQHQIERLVDVRRFPGSRKYPHFNRESFAKSLAEAGVQYDWIELLGGRRPKQRDFVSPNLGLRNESFRNYADYMATDDFRAGLQQLLQGAKQKRTAFMCSESVFWRCHRRLISDYLLAHDFSVQHIMPSGELRPHTLTSGAKIVDGEIIFPPVTSDQERMLFE